MQVHTGKLYEEGRISITNSITKYLVTYRIADYSPYVKFYIAAVKFVTCNTIDFNFTNCICVQIKLVFTCATMIALDYKMGKRACSGVSVEHKNVSCRYCRYPDVDIVKQSLSSDYTNR
jgi:hypothetical protein